MALADMNLFAFKNKKKDLLLVHAKDFCSIHEFGLVLVISKPDLCLFLQVSSESYIELWGSLSVCWR